MSGKRTAVIGAANLAKQQLGTLQEVAKKKAELPRVQRQDDAAKERAKIMAWLRKKEAERQDDAAKERAKIVAWLRKKIDDQPNIVVRTYLRVVTQAIKRGEHDKGHQQCQP